MAELIHTVIVPVGNRRGTKMKKNQKSQILSDKQQYLNRSYVHHELYFNDSAICEKQHQQCIQPVELIC